jgi:mono/diheme cytochrome c family protein
MKHVVGANLARQIELQVLLALVLAAAFMHNPRPAFSAGPAPGSYRVVGDKVDPGTYAGWLIYHTACFVCHGRDGVGTDIAPGLMESVRRMTPRDFTVKVLTRYRITVPALEASTDDQAAVREAIIAEVLKAQRGGPGSVSMPAWQSNEGIEPHVLDIYAYLRARADGALGPGQPKLIRDN